MKKAQVILFERLQRWRKQIGYKLALSGLIEAKLSKSMAEKLLAECYKKELKPITIDAIETAMKGK